MTAPAELKIERFRDELRRHPPAALEALEKAWETMSAALDPDQLYSWARTGVDMAGYAVRSWEAAARYYDVSPRVIALVPINAFLRWAESGSGLCKRSPTLASAFLEASPGTIPALGHRHIETWARLGSSLYRGSWKSSTLSCDFFKASPALLESLSISELERFVELIGALSQRSYDQAAESLALGQKLFPVVGEATDAFLGLAQGLVETSWRQVKGVLDAGVKAIPRVEANQRRHFIAVLDRLARGNGVNASALMLEMSESMAMLSRENHRIVLDLGETLLDISLAVVPSFVKSCHPVLRRISPDQLEQWFEEGVRVLRQNHDGGWAYFKLESTHSERVLETLSSSVEFERVSDIMEMYCCALAGTEVKLSPTAELVEKNIGWVSGEAPSTEGSSIFVPSKVDRYPTKEENFAWYKVVSTHQEAHLEFGSFRFLYEKPSTLFENLRPHLRGKGPRGIRPDVPCPDESDVGAREGWVTDIQRFFDQFEDRKLALDIFTVVEDGRLDSRVMAEYRGIGKDYRRVQLDSLGGRPKIRSLLVREAMVEFLVRLSLRQYEGLAAPARYIREARNIAGIAGRVFVPVATVEDVAEATLRIYAILSRIPNEGVPPEEWADLDIQDNADEIEIDAMGLTELLKQFAEGAKSEAGHDDKEYQPVQDVEFRGDFKPELVQILALLREQQSGQGREDASQIITREMLEELLENTAELNMQALLEGLQNTPNTLANSMLKEAGLDRPQTPGLGGGPHFHVDEEGGPLDASEPQTYVYDEWDFRANDYKPAWCVVRQKPMAEGDPQYFDSTLYSYSSLVTQVRRQFELMVPEMFRRVRKLEDGEDIDIDDVIEAMVDIRTGAGPSEKLFWRRNKVQRDVAVAFLMDTSASTAEAIDETRRTTDDWDAPSDPVEYMVWLRTRRGEGVRRSYKRIIDLEKEAIVLLINALESIGDVYGIYGFSGYGRENVEFYTVKDITENLTERVKRRIDRVAPLHATRMGPAIRHATSKLEVQDARTKLLFLISDGRPQDRGYSREGVEKEYAVHDTRKALDEAKRKDITAFCLTVDRNGHDYLKTMCQDIGYEVLDDIFTLPQRLLYLYRRLTM